MTDNKTIVSGPFNSAKKAVDYQSRMTILGYETQLVVERMQFYVASKRLNERP